MPVTTLCRCTEVIFLYTIAIKEWIGLGQAQYSGNQHALVV